MLFRLDFLKKMMHIIYVKKNCLSNYFLGGGYGNKQANDSKKYINNERFVRSNEDCSGKGINDGIGIS